VRYSLTYRDLEEIMAERGLSVVDFVYAPGMILAGDLTANPLVQHRRIALDPAPDRDMIDPRR
jgi:hypothetical protein